MNAIPDLFRPEWSHGPGCQCLPCLKTEYSTANEKSKTAGRRYIELRQQTKSTPATLNAARTQWTESRQALVLAEHLLRTAEDNERFTGAGARWNPEDAR